VFKSNGGVMVERFHKPSAWGESLRRRIAL
jgi:hypothetical protein